MVENLLEQLHLKKEAGDLDGQIEVLRELREEYEVKYNPDAEIEVIRKLANVYHEKDELHKAHSLRMEAAEILNEYVHSPISEISIEGDLGRSFLHIGDFEHAEQHTNRALELAVSMGDDLLVCTYQLNLALIYLKSGKEQEGRALFDKILKKASELENHYLLSLFHLHLSVAHLNEGRITECHESARKAITHADFANNDLPLPQIVSLA